MSKGITRNGKSKSFRIDDIIIHNSDFLKLELEKESIDLIVTSPPYNIGIEYGKYDDNKTYTEYVEFTKNWLLKCFEALKSGGRICINVPLSINNHSIAADLTILAKRAGFKYKGTIIWNKQNTKNKHAMVFSKNIEVVLVLYKESWKPVKIEYKEWVNEVWQFSGENPKRVNHPAAFPVEVPRRLIKMFSEVGEAVLDPFVGSGTTLVACSLLNRRGIAVEIDEKYFEVARKKIEEKKW